MLLPQIFKSATLNKKRQDNSFTIIHTKGEIVECKIP